MARSEILKYPPGSREESRKDLRLWFRCSDGVGQDVHRLSRNDGILPSNYFSFIQNKIII